MDSKLLMFGVAVVVSVVGSACADSRAERIDDGLWDFTAQAGALSVAACGEGSTSACGECGASCDAQVIWSEGFERDDLASFTYINGDVSIVADGDERSARFAGPIDGELQIFLDTSNYSGASVRFLSRASTSGEGVDGSDYFTVRYSTDCGQTWTQAERIQNSFPWTSRSLKLPSAGSLHISLVFDSTSEADVAFVDEITVSGTLIVPGVQTTLK